jgi:hypothetical protein
MSKHKLTDGRTGIGHKAEEWWLFIDSNKVTSKAVLLHNRNKKTSTPVAYATGMKETYESMSHILNSLEYKEHHWQLCDLKVIMLLLRLQGGFTKYCCFLYLWDT